MINEISRNLTGVTGGKPAREVGKVAAVQDSALVREARKTGTEKDSTQEAEKAASVDGKQLNKIVDELNGFAQVVQRQLEFSIDEDNGDVIVKVVDAETRDVVREIPPEEIREMQKRLSEISDKLFQKDDKTALLFQAKA